MSLLFSTKVPSTLDKMIQVTQKICNKDFLVAQWLGKLPANAGDMSDPRFRKIPHAMGQLSPATTTIFEAKT